ncbi:hypothetical protein QPX26_06800, partial [Corynebacterium accolens]|uniref:hypothetical protein n=1 Tax=Corynebacterium accolens TaxID=38284 RepID=UPI0025431CAB
MHRILITEPIRTRTDFFNALGRTHGCVDCGPRSLEDLAKFLRENEVSTIVAANMEMRLPSFSGHPISADLVSVGEDVHCEF